VLLSEQRYLRIRARWQQLRRQGKPWVNRHMINNVLGDFRSHIKRAGIKPVGKLTIHTLWKSCGQNWADYLAMNVVKELMGHSSIATTQEFYTQVDSDHEAKAARVLQQLIDGADTKEGNWKTDARLTPEANSGQIGGDR
jgi:integrase